MKNVRVFYNKTGDLKYISHLDMNRVFIRLLRRSGLPIWYTEGFNPHPKLAFALPLSLGFESESEIVDVRIADDDCPCEEVAKRLADVMPNCLHIKYAADPVMKAGDISFARYLVKTENLPDLTAFFDQQRIITEKRSKSGVKSVDIRNMIKEYSVCNNDLTLVLSAGADNLNPMLVIRSIEEFYNISIDIVKVVRTDVYDKNMAQFR